MSDHVGPRVCSSWFLRVSGIHLPHEIKDPCMEVFGSSGTRGIANEDLTPEFVVKIAKALGTIEDADRIAVARDTRRSGQMLAAASASGLASVGVDVALLGVVPTPGVQCYAEHHGVPAIVITASHNPPEYNGVKIIGASGIEYSITELQTLERILRSGSFETVPWDRVGQLRTVENANTAYVDAVVGAVDGTQIASADLTVAVDPGHGAGAITNPVIYRKLGCRVITIHSDPNGYFPGRNPEPVEQNLSALRQLVRTTDADVGIAHDGDADRAIFIDEHGQYIEGDGALAAFATVTLEDGDVAVSAVNVSQRLVDVAADVNARLELTPVGSTRIVSRIQELQHAGEHVAIAGEGNGGIIFPEYRLTRDGAYTAARFLEMLAEQPASEIIASFDAYHNVRVNIEYESHEHREAMLDAVVAFANAESATLSTVDGYRLDYGDAWVLVRPSGTEPIIRMYAEATDPDRAQELVDRVQRELESATE